MLQALIKYMCGSISILVSLHKDDSVAANLLLRTTSTGENSALPLASSDVPCAEKQLLAWLNFSWHR